jgi:argininosuccinate synthase
MEKKINKVVLAYSGGLDTSAMLLWIKETYGCEVVCFCADVGQGEELDGLEEKAKTGASKLYVEDLREEFVAISSGRRSKPTRFTKAFIFWELRWRVP